jgi:hypothetical protein
LPILLTITGHARLAGNTGRDEDDLGVGKSILEAGGSRIIASDGAVGVDVAEISGNTWHIQLSVNAVETSRSQKGLPGPPRISYRASWVTRGFSFINKERGWPMPPPAPRTVTLEAFRFSLGLAD